MGTDDQNRIWFSQSRRKLAHEIYHCLVAGITKNWQRPSAMRKIDDLGFILRRVLIQHINLPGFFVDEAFQRQR